MTWVKGTTTWQNCVSDLTKLICGEMADGSAVTVASGDQWIREIAGQDLLRTPASKDVALGNMSNRMGYFSETRQVWTANVTNSGTPIKTVCRCTNIFTSNPATTAGRWVVLISVNGQNTVQNNYSTSTLNCAVYDADTGTNITGNFTASISAAGVATIYLGMQVTVTDPSGFLVAGAQFVRGYTTTYLGGIDWWGPMYSRRSAAATFSVNPSGTSATDWDVVDIPVGSTQPLGISGGHHQGLGIKTNTGLSGNLYTCTWSAALQKMRMVALSGANNGQITLQAFSGGAVDTVFQNPTYRQEGGFSVATWLRPYQTPASVTNASVIQYWMSVKADKVLVILNADPAQTGKLTCAWLGTYTPQFPSSDKFPCACSPNVIDYTADNLQTRGFDLLQQFKINAQKHRLDGSESRDWQTGWMRGDFFAVASGTDSYSEMSSGFASLTLYVLNLAGVGSSSGVGQMMAPPRQTKPHPIDGNWWLYGMVLSDELPANTVTAANNSDNEIIKGKLDGPWYFIPGDGWGTGDELTDSVTSKVYYLLAADYQGMGARVRTGTNAYVGGLAVLEE